MESSPPQWEYCQLVFIGARVLTNRPGPGRVPAPGSDEAHYHLEIVYAGPDGRVAERQLASFEQTRSHNPLYQVIGLLGGAGWELVAMEPSRDYAWGVEDREIVPYAAGLRPVSRVAHFKRVVVPGRRVDEPAIELHEM